MCDKSNESFQVGGLTCEYEQVVNVIVQSTTCKAIALFCIEIREIYIHTHITIILTQPPACPSLLSRYAGSVVPLLMIKAAIKTVVTHMIVCCTMVII